MIKLEVIESNQNEEVGIYHYEFDSLIVGNLKSCDLILSYTERITTLFKLSIKDSELKFETLENDFLLINGKKFSGEMIVKIGDVITYGNSKVKILDFSKTLTPSEISLERYEDIIKNKPLVKKLVIGLEDEIERLSQK